MTAAAGGPALSVVVPTYNRAASLHRFLVAFGGLEQPDGGAELIVVDDGSTDTTPEICSANSAVTYLRQDNRGPAAARNLGWRSSKAPVVAFADDDVVPDPRWLTDIQDALRSCPGADGVGGTILPLHRGLIEDFVQLERLADHSTEGGRVRYLVTANAAFRRAALYAVGGFDESFRTGEDVDLSARLISSGHNLIVAPRALVRHDHRTNARGLMQNYFRSGRMRRVLARRHKSYSAAAWADPGAQGRDPFHIHRYRAEGVRGLRLPLYVAWRTAALTVFLFGFVLESSCAVLGRRRPTGANGSSTEPTSSPIQRGPH